MKKYCFDTSGLSNPYVDMPDDIYTGLWQGVMAVVSSGIVAVTAEIYEEMAHIQGDLGACIQNNKAQLQLEVGESTWNWQAYIAHITRMRTQHYAYISEYTGGRKGTVGLNDLTIVADTVGEVAL